MSNRRKREAAFQEPVRGFWGRFEDPDKAKKWAKRIGLALFLLVAGVAFLWYQFGPVDRIENYQVEVVPQSDGALEITYRFKWRVVGLREGPLTWVEIGMANSNFDVLDFGGDISSQGDHGATMAWFNLNKRVQLGQSTEFWFTVRQEKMLCRNLLREAGPGYDFTPGWFNQIKVEEYLFRWANSPQILTSNGQLQGDWLVWQGSLGKGQTDRMVIFYQQDAFPMENAVEWWPYSTQDYDSEDYGASSQEWVTWVFAIFFGVLWAALGGGRRSYRRGRGFHGGGGGRGCACACAGCACACACAGGGRAGCSMKDFYQPNPFGPACQRLAQKDAPHEKKAP